MAPGPKWYPLPAFPDLPSLMLSPRFASSSYTLHMTDLANVWVETLDRKGILLRSLQEDTSIDLSDADQEQWAVFISKLKAAFDPTSPDHHLTSLSLSASSDASTKDGLDLHVTCVLPKPLKPLKWPVHLTKCQPVALASELVLPLIQAHHARAQETEDLIKRLKEKDAVITKLVDKLEAMGTGLEHVFNSLSGKRKITKAMAEDKVKGLGLFNKDDWTSHWSTSREIPEDVPSFIQDAFNHSGLDCATERDIGASNQLNDWWTKLPPDSYAAVKPQKVDSPTTSQHVPLPATKSPGDGDDDDFQVQATPPHLQSTRNQTGHTGAHDDTTDDDEEPEHIPDSYPARSQGKPRSRLGALGGKKATQESSASQSSRTAPAAEDDETASESDKEPIKPQPTKRPNARLSAIGKSKKSSPPPAKSSSPAPPPPKDDETVSGSDSDDDEASKLPPPPKPAPTQKRKGGLGRIGGKPRSSPAPSQEPSEVLPDAEASKVASPAKPTGRKIGAIGKKTGGDAKRPRSATPAEPEESENEEQKAERKRVELAKELERKAAAPAKKKRRF